MVTFSIFRDTAHQGVSDWRKTRGPNRLLQLFRIKQYEAVYNVGHSWPSVVFDFHLRDIVVGRLLERAEQCEQKRVGSSGSVYMLLQDVLYTLRDVQSYLAIPVIIQHSGIEAHYYSGGPRKLWEEVLKWDCYECRVEAVTSFNLLKLKRPRHRQIEWSHQWYMPPAYCWMLHSAALLYRARVRGKEWGPWPGDTC